MEKQIISTQQFFVLVFLFTLGDTIILAPSMLATFAKSNAWLSSLVGLIFGLFLVMIYCKFSDMYPKMSYVEILSEVLGTWLGNMMSIVFLFTIFIMVMANMREVGDFFTTQVMPETPIEAILALTFLTVIYILHIGIENIARTAEVFFPWIIFMLLFLLLLLIPEVEIKQLTPTFVDGIGPILGTTYAYTGYSFSGLVVFLMVMPFINKQASVKKNFLIGVITGGIFLSIITAMCIAVLGVDITGRNLYPTYMLGKKISIGDFLQRIEVFVGISWILTIFFKIVIGSFAISLGCAQILKLSDYKPLLFPLGFFSLVCSMIFFPNIVYFNTFGVSVWSHHSMIVFVLIPLMVLVIAFIKKKL